MRARLALDLPGLPARVRLADDLRPAGPGRPPGLADHGPVDGVDVDVSLPSACSPSTVTVCPTNGASGWSSPHHHGGPASSSSTVAVDGQRVLGLALRRRSACRRCPSARQATRPGRSSLPTWPGGPAMPSCWPRPGMLVLRTLAGLRGRLGRRGRVGILVRARGDRAGRCASPGARRPSTGTAIATAARAATAMASLGRRGSDGMGGVCGGRRGRGSMPNAASWRSRGAGIATVRDGPAGRLSGARATLGG